MDRVVWLTFAALAAIACGNSARPSDDSADPPWASNGAVAPPRPGMVWIPKGTLIVGTPLDQSPRVADAEMAGEQVVMGDFYIDIYPYPNEAGAIPKTNIDRDEATSLCAEQGKRLCTEIELERACKGPDNLAYPYGADYRASACETGENRPPSPNGFNGGCVTGFGVSDTQGSVWEWTSSDWGRGTEGLVTLRGGNSTYGEIVGRCANGRGEKPEKRDGDIGVRCCAGEPNTFQIVLSVDRGEPLKFRMQDKEMPAAFEKLIHTYGAMPEGIIGDDKNPPPPVPPKRGEAPGPTGLVSPSTFHVERTWTWHPIGNEELLLGGGCAKTPRRECGVLVARMDPTGLSPMVFVSTSRWQPTMNVAGSPREIFIYGGDDNGAFRKKLAYEWGKMTISEKQRKRKRGREYYYEPDDEPKKK